MIHTSQASSFILPLFGDAGSAGVLPLPAPGDIEGVPDHRPPGHFSLAPSAGHGNRAALDNRTGQVERPVRSLSSSHHLLALPRAPVVPISRIPTLGEPAGPRDTVEASRFRT